MVFNWSSSEVMEYPAVPYLMVGFTAHPQHLFTLQLQLPGQSVDGLVQRVNLMVQVSDAAATGTQLCLQVWDANQELLFLQSARRCHYCTSNAQRWLLLHSPAGGSAPSLFLALVWLRCFLWGGSASGARQLWRAGGSARRVETLPGRDRVQVRRWGVKLSGDLWSVHTCVTRQICDVV